MASQPTLWAHLSSTAIGFILAESGHRRLREGIKRLIGRPHRFRQPTAGIEGVTHRDRKLVLDVLGRGPKLDTLQGIRSQIGDYAAGGRS